jgi:hypothetical protein
MELTRRWCAAAVACALVAACGGRSTLETYDGPDSASDPSGSDSNRGGSKPGSASGGSKPGGSVGGSNPGSSVGGSSPGSSGTGADPGMPDPGTPDPGDPTPDPGDPGPGPTNPNPSPDVNCTSDHAKGGMACSMPCLTTCGFYDLGMKACDCVNGVFVSCHCPRPWDYQGSPVAPTCNTSDGRTHWIDNTPCTERWAQCIGTDPVSGTNPRGCVCLTDPVNGKLEWTCGSTNRWFLHE